MKKIQYLFPLCVALAAAHAQASTIVPTQTYTFELDGFAVYKNVSSTSFNTPSNLFSVAPIFQDNFNDGNPPPSAPNFTSAGGGGSASYATFGTMGPESTTSGILTMDSIGAQLNNFGTPLQQAILKTNVDPLSSLGLKQSSTNFAVGGLFNLINPGNNIGSYGVRFTDVGPGTGDDIVSLRVRGRTDGQAVVQFFTFNNNTGINTLISEQVLDTNHQQIGLALGYFENQSNANIKAVYAGYFYSDNGLPTANFYDMAGSADLFHGENFTRAAFFANGVAPVPEPETYAMMLAGLALVVSAVRRRT